jgi:glycosyltransferase involved in cell wall biosynthesis
VSDGEIFNFDSSLLEETSDIVVYRTRTFLNFRKKKELLKKNKNAPNNNRISSLKKTGVFSKFINGVKKYAAIPDAFIIWAPSAILNGVNITRSEGVDIIYSTAPPFSNHIAATCLKLLTKIPLVVDFRDAWVSNPMQKWKKLKWKRLNLRRFIEAVLERMVIKNSDMVISTTDGITQDFRQRYPRIDFTKFVTIPNGYDKEDSYCSKVCTAKDPCKMWIVYTGYLKMERSPKPLCEAVRRLVDEKPYLEDLLEVYFIGEVSHFADGEKIEDYIERYKLQKMVKLTGHVTRTEALMYQMSADILLLIIGAVPKEEVFTYGIASKVYDYMLVGKPVLSIADKGPVSELIESTKIGVSIEPSDIDGIKQYLSNSYDMLKDGQLTIAADKDEIAKYDMLTLTEKLTTSFAACSQKVHAK